MAQRLQLEQLDFDPELARARSILRAFRAPNAEQQACCQRILDFIAAHPARAHQRSLEVGHLTASALVVDPQQQRALLTHHKKLQRWLQLGGHCDGDANLAHVALREAVEESGIPDLRIDPTPIDVDIHIIPARAAEPEHWHLDTRFVVYAPPQACERLSEESTALAWFTLAQSQALELDDSVRRLFEIALGAQR